MYNGNPMVRKKKEAMEEAIDTDMSFSKILKDVELCGNTLSSLLNTKEISSHTTWKDKKSLENPNKKVTELGGKNKKNKTSKTQTDIFRSHSGSLPELVAEPNTRSMSFVGSHEYLAPEIIKGEGHGSAVDRWLLLLYGKTPFKGSGNRATLFNVVGEQLKFLERHQQLATREGTWFRLYWYKIQRTGSNGDKAASILEGVNWALIRCSTPPEVPGQMETEPPQKYGPIDPVRFVSNSKRMMGPPPVSAASGDAKAGGQFLDF
ncbi:hypothetical protein Bca101_018146 [Brassica carinata]